MKAEWLFDARKITDEVMNYLRRIAVQAIEEKHYSPSLANSDPHIPGEPTLNGVV